MKSTLPILVLLPVIPVQAGPAPHLMRGIQGFSMGSLFSQRQVWIPVPRFREDRFHGNDNSDAGQSSLVVGVILRISTESNTRCEMEVR